MKNSPTLRNAVVRPYRTMMENLTSAYRRATGSRRTLPDFIIVGAQKSGTSSLFHQLNNHPQLLGSYKKEVHFFDGGLDPADDNFQKGHLWYRSHFPLVKDVRVEQKIFEASPLYLFSPLAPERIYDLIPQVKLIVLLRNPRERAISHYFHNKKKNRETLDIYRALVEEESRLSSAIDSQDYKNEIFIQFSYKSRGLYKDQLERYFKCFSKKQILVIHSEKYFENPKETHSQVFDFVGVDPDFEIKNLKTVNKGVGKKKVPERVYEYLDHFFQPHNQALYDMLGEDFGW